MGRLVAPHPVQAASKTIEGKSEMQCSLNKGRLTEGKQDHAQLSGSAKGYTHLDREMSATLYDELQLEPHC